MKGGEGRMGTVREVRMRVWRVRAKGGNGQWWGEVWPIMASDLHQHLSRLELYTLFYGPLSYYVQFELKVH